MSNKKESDELPEEILEKINGGVTEIKDKGDNWRDWPKCSRAYTDGCPGFPSCRLFKTAFCINGHYNLDKARGY